MRIASKSSTLIRGQSGAGKSTLADLLTGLIEPEVGSITIDGAPLTGTNRRRWRKSIAYVQQSGFLFNNSIRANLLWAHPNASDIEIEIALRSAAADFVFELPDGLDTEVGDGGQNLSGGERQRLALARTLLGKPSLLILDEATSALDPDNEALVSRSLSNLRGKITTIVISHRLNNLDHFDLIVEMKSGKMEIIPGKLGSDKCAAGVHSPVENGGLP